MDVQLTKNFNLSEFAVSKEHPELAAKIEFSETDKAKYFFLCRMILQPVRDNFGHVEILSGKRTEELNTAIHGSESSDHKCVEYSVAADFTLLDFPQEVPIEQSQASYIYGVWDWIHVHIRCYGQLIYYPNKHFIHVSLPTKKHYLEAFSLT